MSIRVLVTDGLAAEGLDLLRAHPEFKLEVRKSTPASELASALSQADCVVIRSATTLTADAIAAGRSLRLIVRAGAGVDNIDMAAARAAGIPVMNTASANSLAAAEQTLGLMFAVMRWIPQSAQSLREGKWDRDSFKGREVTGKTLVVIGLGHIGKIVAEKALGLGMKVVGFDAAVKQRENLPKRLYGDEHFTLAPSMDDALTHGDVLSVHVPKTPATTGLIDHSKLSLLNKGAYLLQCARGGVVDEAAVLAALETGQLAGAAFDVFEKEPPAFPNALIAHPRVVAVPHLGASTFEAQDRVATTAAQQMIGFFLKNEHKGIL